MFIYSFSDSEQILTLNANDLASDIVGRKLKQVKTIEPSHGSWSLRLIDGEIWSGQSNGVSVNDTTLTPVKHLNIGCTYDVALLSGENVVFAGDTLREMSKSDTE